MISRDNNDICPNCSASGTTTYIVNLVEAWFPAGSIIKLLQCKTSNYVFVYLVRFLLCVVLIASKRSRGYDKNNAVHEQEYLQVWKPANIVGLFMEYRRDNGAGRCRILTNTEKYYGGILNEVEKTYEKK